LNIVFSGKEGMRIPMKHESIRGLIYAFIMISSMLLINIFYSMRFVEPAVASNTSKIVFTSSSHSSSSSESLESTMPDVKNEDMSSSPENMEDQTESELIASEPERVEHVSREYYDVPLSYDLQDLIFSECGSKNVPADLVIALIDVESDFNPNMISKTNDYGLMQINICHKDSLNKALKITNLLDEEQNIKAGVYMLSGIVNKYSNVNQALMVYNCGESGAKRLWNSGVYSTDYSKKVIKTIEEIKS